MAPGPAVCGRVVLARHIALRVVPDGSAFLLSERGSAVVDDPVAVQVLERADGRGYTSVLTELAPRWGADQVRSTLERLSAAGILAPDSSDAVEPADTAGEVPDAREAGFWEAAGLRADEAARSCRRPVAIRALDPGCTGATAALRAAGVDAAEPGHTGDPALEIVLVDDYLHPDLVRLDADLRRSGRAWMPAKPMGARLWVGPVLGIGHGCYTCLGERMRAHRVAEQAVGDTGPAPSWRRPVTDIAATRALGYSLVATVTANWLAGNRSAGSAITIVDAATLTSSTHRPPRRPQCPRCGDPTTVARTMSAPLRVPPAGAAVHTDGGRRAVAPERMLADLAHLVDPVVGVVAALEPVPGRVPVGHVVTAGPNRAMPVPTVRALRGSLRARSCGKGVGEAQARASALGEALERASGVFQGDEPRVRATRADLGDEAVHPDELQLFSARQQAEGYATGSPDAGPYDWVPEPFDPSEELDWTPVWSLTRERRRYVPTALLFYGYDGPGAGRGLLADSNGAAAGTSLGDALLQGCYELVERDAVAVWWYNRLSRPAVDLDTAGSWIASARGAHEALGRELWALDLTSDIGIPTVVALSRRPDGPTEDIVFGFGAHADRRIALHRAVGEVHQFLGAVQHGDGADVTGNPVHRMWWSTATVRSEPYLWPDATAPPVRVAGTTPGDLDEEWETCRRRVESAGLEVLAVDMTRPDIGLPVAKVIVPGMRHFWPRFAPGRLFDVPVRTGDLAVARDEADLNPVPVFV